MKILVLGSGGREHAIIRALMNDPAVEEIHAAPGNAGIGGDVPVHAVSETDPDAVVQLTQQLAADLVVVGPEAPLAAGVTDALRAAGIATFGPSQQAARLESSKAFAKEIMSDAGVPTASARVATTAEEAAAALDEFGAPYVVKDDGLAAGKGVVVTEDRAEALAHAQSCFDGGSQVVIEEFLDGPEVSLFVIADGTDAVALQPAQDFKRIFDGDVGPNTGGMGAYTPLDWLPDGFVDEVLDTVARPVLEQMVQRGTPFNGVLYCGLAVTARGVRVIEFNTRFGDPETQAVLAQLRSPLGQLLHAAATSELNGYPALEWEPGYAVDVVVAAAGYPGTPRKGDEITGLDEVQAPVLHAGTVLGEHGTYLSAGGRLLAVVGQGETLAAAREQAYAGVATLSLDGGQWRTDIGLKAERGDIQIPGEEQA
ncbi:phosphoribosylamine--glycine ligase [Citricoccus muralis]|uniref:Phosphoribosylamine--glycine ligase n=1 Tax=Citricoccus muralis TaxID=169134 RepID=A0ABY8H4F3_9MICC|nr:phosphoribosylamine--glycine ligase [Citricoccus muralis]WFP16014.1 phosphoribosylamine--glycine ligase [Citricoccus muralis]